MKPSPLGEGSSPEGREERDHHEREAVLFASAVRALSAYGFSNLDFDIGGKKARRRYVSARAPGGENVVIWIKASTCWRDMAEAVRFPWKKLSISPDGQAAVAVACEAAAQRGATHLLAVTGNDQTGVLSFVRLYPLAQLPELVAKKAALIDSVFYRAHSAALILHAYSPEFDEAAEAAKAVGEDIFSPPHTRIRKQKAKGLFARAPARSIAEIQRCAQRFLRSRMVVANAAVRKAFLPRATNGILKRIMSLASPKEDLTPQVILLLCALHVIERRTSLQIALK